MKNLITLIRSLLRAEWREVTICDEQGNLVKLRVLVLPEKSA